MTLSKRSSRDRWKVNPTKGYAFTSYQLAIGMTDGKSVSSSQVPPRQVESLNQQRCIQKTYTNFRKRLLAHRAYKAHLLSH